MPALQPQAVPDKAMTFDLSALQNGNEAAASTPTSAALQGPTTTAQSVPVAQDTDFAAPQGPWVNAPSAPAPAPTPAPSQPAAAPQQQQGNPWAALASQRPQTPPSGPPQQQGPQNPWAAMQSQQAGPLAQPSVVAGPPVQQSAAPAMPPAQSVSAKGSPVAVASAPAVPTLAASAAAESSPAAPAATPAQRQCFTNAEGLKICYMDDEQHKNTTDVHKEHGVNDYHNQVSAQEKEAIQGHIPGNHVTASLSNLGQPQDPNNQDGSTAFQGQSDKNFNHQHDIHKDNATYSDHDTTTSNSDQDWKSSHKGKDGSKDMAEINREGQYENTSDTKIDDQGKDQVDVETWKGSDDHRFLSDKPGTKDNSSLVWDEDNDKQKQREEWTGRDGVYDLHEESKGKTSVKASVDGDQGWTHFEQEMRDFDAAFNGDQAWKIKMKDLGMVSTTPTAVAGPAATTMAVVRRTAMPGVPAKRQFEGDTNEDYWFVVKPWLKEIYETDDWDGLNKRDVEKRVQASMESVCKPGDTAFQCICRRSTDHISCAMAWPSTPKEEEAGEKMLLQAREEKGKSPKIRIPSIFAWFKHKDDDDDHDDDDDKKVQLESRDVQENPYKQTFEWWLNNNEVQKEQGAREAEEFKKLQQMASEAKHHHGHERRLAGLPEVDYANEQNGNEHRPTDMPHFDSSTLVVPAGPIGIGATGSSDDDAATAKETNNSNMEKLSTIVLVCMIVLLAATLGVLVGRRVNTCLKKRKERRARQSYMQEIEGCHVVNIGRNGWQGSQQG